jgi:hypothetical protein
MGHTSVCDGQDGLMPVCVMGQTPVAVMGRVCQMPVVLMDICGCDGSETYRDR